MKTINEHKKVIMDYHKNCIDSFKTIFELKQHMINLRICPRCGEPNRGGLVSYTINCYDCGLKITDNEAYLINEKNHKRILSRKLKS